MRFIHIADVHLGVTPDAGRPWSEKRAKDIWNSFGEVIERAKELQPDFLFIAGDLFHAQPLKKDLSEVNALFSQISQTKVILMAGNHDYLRQKSYYLSYQWAENVHFFRREEADCMDFPEKNVAVYGLSYWHRAIGETLYDRMMPINPKRINILLAHGGDAGHIPFSPEKILRNGFDYVAAGHIHKGGQLILGRAVMAGSLEPTDCNDVGPHGYWVGEIEKGGAAKLQFFPIKKCEYCHETYMVTRETTSWMVRKWAEELLSERPAYQYFRLTLEGYKNPENSFDCGELLELERVVDVTERLRTAYDYDRLAEDYQGSLLERYIRHMQAGTQDIVRKKALEYGVGALLDEE